MVKTKRTISKTIKEEYRLYEKDKRAADRRKHEAEKKLAGEQRQLEIIRRDKENKKKAQRDDFQNNRQLQIVEREVANHATDIVTVYNYDSRFP